MTRPQIPAKLPEGMMVAEGKVALSYLQSYQVTTEFNQI